MADRDGMQGAVSDPGADVRELLVTVVEEACADYRLLRSLGVIGAGGGIARDARARLLRPDRDKERHGRLACYRLPGRKVDMQRIADLVDFFRGGMYRVFAEAVGPHAPVGKVLEEFGITDRGGYRTFCDVVAAIRQGRRALVPPAGWVGAKELATMLDVSPRTIHRKVRAGIMPGPDHPMGGQRWSVAAVRRIMGG